MTELSTYGAGAHVASMLGVSWGGQSTEGTDVFRTLGANVVGRSTLEASYHGGCGRGGISVTFGLGRDEHRLKRLVSGF